MKRSIAVAILISIALHVVAVFYLHHTRDRVSLAGAPTVMNVRFWEPDDRYQVGEPEVPPAPEPMEPESRQAGPEPGRAEPERAAPSLPPGAPLVTAAAAAGPAGGAPREVAPDEGEVSPAGGVDESGATTQRADLLAAISPRPHQAPAPSEAAPAPPEPVPMSAHERRMLSRKIRHWSEEYQPSEEWDSGFSWDYEGRQYRVRFSPEPAADDMGIERVRVEISTEQEGRTLSAQMRMKRLAFSNFAQFVDRWDPEVQIHDDELDGRFHSNSTIHLDASGNARPRFLGKVTTSSRAIDTSAARGRLRRDEVFLGGLETRVGKIVLPKHFVPFPTADGIDPNEVIEFDRDTRITFYPDGSYGWKEVGSAVAETLGELSEHATYLVGAPKKKLYLSGVVNGTVLVYSPERIVITGDLTYAEDPVAPAASPDYLGVVCDKTVEVAHPDVTGPGDLEIHAAIYAKRRFAVRGYRLRHRAVLTIYGSLTAGTLSATEPRFATRIRFDRRLENTRPPGFPLSDRYEFEAWDQEWEVETDPDLSAQRL